MQSVEKLSYTGVIIVICATKSNGCRSNRGMLFDGDDIG